MLIEHNLDVIKLADWVIDLGPEAGSGGGEMVATGRPEEVAAVDASHTGRWLRRVLGTGTPATAFREVPDAPDGASRRPRAAARAPRARAKRT